MSLNTVDPAKLQSQDDSITCDCPPMNKVPDWLKASVQGHSRKCKMSEWLLQRYAAQFLMYTHINHCSQQINLPLLEIKLEEGA